MVAPPDALPRLYNLMHWPEQSITILSAFLVWNAFNNDGVVQDIPTQQQKGLDVRGWYVSL